MKKYTAYCSDALERDLQEELSKRVYRELLLRYGETSDEIILRRTERELYVSEVFEMSRQLLAFHDFAMLLRKSRVPYVLEGDTAACFLLYLLGISSANPLPPHYYCPSCKRVVWDNSFEDGFDLPERRCICGQSYSGDGHDMPCESFWSAELDTYRLGEERHCLYITIPESERENAYNFFMEHPLLRGFELKYRIGFPHTFYAEHITVTTDKLLLTDNSTQWFEPVNPARIALAAIHYVESTEKEFLEESGCKVSSFFDAVRVMGLSHSGICYDWDKNGSLLIAGKAIPAARLPAHYDDLYKFFSDKMLMKDVFRQIDLLCKGEGFLPQSEPFEDLDWLEKYIGNASHAKAHTVELLLARAKLQSIFSLQAPAAP